MSVDQSSSREETRDPLNAAMSGSSPAMCWLLAVLSFGAGTVHLVMVPQHAQESLGMGLAFAAAGWFPIAFGVALLVAPRRIWLWLAIAGNLVLVATWAVSRTVGLPGWTGDGGTQDARAADHVHGGDDADPVASGAHGHGTGSGSVATESADHDHDAAADHEHTGSTVTYAELPKRTEAEVDQAIALWANRYPTAADARRDGWFPATPSL